VILDTPELRPLFLFQALGCLGFPLLGEKENVLELLGQLIGHSRLGLLCLFEELLRNGALLDGPEGLA
jgi:hypothetical protein